MGGRAKLAAPPPIGRAVIPLLETSRVFHPSLALV